MTAEPLQAVEAEADATAAGVDDVLATRASTTADVLTGLLATGTLHHAGSPRKLPTLQWPDVDPDTVQAIWDAGAAAGYWAGRQQAATHWHTDALDAARQQLADAGYEAMARQVTAAAYAAPSRPIPAIPTLQAGDPA